MPLPGVHLKKTEAMEMIQCGLKQNFHPAIKSLINSMRGPPLTVVAFLYNGILKIKIIYSAPERFDIKNQVVIIGMLTCVLMNHPKCVHAWNGVMSSISVNCAL